MWYKSKTKHFFWAKKEADIIGLPTTKIYSNLEKWIKKKIIRVLEENVSENHTKRVQSFCLFSLLVRSLWSISFTLVALHIIQILTDNKWTSQPQLLPWIQLMYPTTCLIYPFNSHKAPSTYHFQSRTIHFCSSFPLLQQGLQLENLG